MLKVALGVVVLLTQLSGPGGELPQILHPAFKAAAPIKAGKKTDVIVSFDLTKGFVINHTPPVSLKVTAVPGVTLEKMDFSTPSPDPKSKDEYYVDLPTIKVPVSAMKAGKYEIPGKLRYFFCSKTDGFCSVQSVDVKIPVDVQ